MAGATGGVRRAASTGSDRPGPMSGRCDGGLRMDLAADEFVG